MATSQQNLLASGSTRGGRVSIARPSSLFLRDEQFATNRRSLFCLEVRPQPVRIPGLKQMTYMLTVTRTTSYVTRGLWLDLEQSRD